MVTVTRPRSRVGDLPSVRADILQPPAEEQRG